MNEQSKKMWQGRFGSGMASSMEALSFSLKTDLELLTEDIDGSIAHAGGLQQAGVLTPSEYQKIVSTLKQIRIDHFAGHQLFRSSDEDIHMGIERVLTERIGDLGKKLHTGRSRNDQVATDFRLYVRNRSQEIRQEILGLQHALVEKAKEYQDDLMPGYTHMQQAQPIRIAHYLLAFFYALERDRKRFQMVCENSDRLPLGSGALAGSAFPYDRKQVAKELGFSLPTENSIDATAHRDFALEFLGATAIVGTLLSRYAEDFVTWCTSEFGYLEIGEEFTTGSSMMPQKKNPDSMELIRGKTGRLGGDFIALFTTVKGAPLCYSRDLQEDKEPVFDAAKQILLCLRVMREAVASLIFRMATIREKMDSGMLATDVADHLVRCGIPFREAHETVGKMVKEAEQRGVTLVDLSSQEWAKLPKGETIQSHLSFHFSTQQRNISGGTGAKSVQAQLKQAQELLQKAV